MIIGVCPKENFVSRDLAISDYLDRLLVYRFFGFEGSSVEHGGYIQRGFDDIGWLPNS